MNHFTLPRFGELYNQLPAEVRRLADKNYRILKVNTNHPSLHFKKIGQGQQLWSVRVGISYRALGRESDRSIVWFWIGSHAEYDRLIS